MYIALASGLGVGGAAGEPLAVSLLVDWLTGLLGGPTDQAQAAQVRQQTIKQPSDGFQLHLLFPC